MRWLSSYTDLIQQVLYLRWQILSYIHGQWHQFVGIIASSDRGDGNNCSLLGRLGQFHGRNIFDSGSGPACQIRLVLGWRFDIKWVWHPVSKWISLLICGSIADFKGCPYLAPIWNFDGLAFWWGRFNYKIHHHVWLVFSLEWVSKCREVPIYVT